MFARIHMVLSTKDLMHLALFFIVILDRLMKLQRDQVNNEAIRTEIVVPGCGIAITHPGSAVPEVVNLVRLCAKESGHIKHYSRIQ